MQLTIQFTEINEEEIERFSRANKEPKWLTQFRIDSFKKYATGFEDILFSMKETHENIVNIIKDQSEKPQSVDAVCLARQQLEWIFAVALFIENISHWWKVYERDAWQNLYTQSL